MHAPPPLVLVPRPSLLAALLIAATHAPTAALVAWLALPPALRGALWLAVAVSALRGLRATIGAGVPRSVRVGIDRRLTLTARDGRQHAGEIVGESYVGAGLATIVWRPDHARRTRTLLVLPDTLAADDFRRLRVHLRYGRPAPAEGTSGEEAG
jgi:hypothetical protein